MNNEPVAYGMFKDGSFIDAIHPDEYHRIEGSYDTPLYTHPAKTLTDEEILELKDEYTKVPSKPWSGIPMAHFDVCGFARAILRKAQEK